MKLRKKRPPIAARFGDLEATITEYAEARGRGRIAWSRDLRVRLDEMADDLAALREDLVLLGSAVWYNADMNACGIGGQSVHVRAYERLRALVDGSTWDRNGAVKEELDRSTNG